MSLFWELWAFPVTECWDMLSSNMFCVAPDRGISLAFFCWHQIPDFGLFAWKGLDAGEICPIWASLIESSTLFRNVFDEQKVHRLCYRIVQFYFFPVRGEKKKS